MINSDLKFLMEQNDAKPTTPPIPLVSTYIEGRRILPAGSPFPGVWSNEKTPYHIEIMDCMSPDLPIQIIAYMKPVQVGATQGVAESSIAYWMDENPTEILYVSATEPLLKKWVPKNLEPLIDSCGFRHKIYSQSQIRNPKSRKIGDLAMSKQYPGGTLDLSSAQSGSGLRQSSKRIVIIDEADGAPRNLKTGEGNFYRVAKGRTLAWNERKKILIFSTPTIVEDSIIWEEFQLGDKRHFFIPCPLCGKHQILEDNIESDAVHGLKGDFEGGVLINAYYICDYCHDAIFNHHKTDFLKTKEFGGKAEWRPTEKSYDPVRRSYTLNSLYSPVGMMSFKGYYQEYLDSQNDVDGMRSFTNLYRGKPYRDEGSRPKWQNVSRHRGNYRSEEVPEGVLFLTASIDVQVGSKGSKKKENPPRLEMEVCGHGARYTTASILYKVFEGEIIDPNSGAWQMLDEYMEETRLIWARKRDGFEFLVQAVFIDSGVKTDIVYQYCQQWPGIYPIKGTDDLTVVNAAEKLKRGDRATPQNFMRYRISNIGSEMQLITIATNYYKKWIYNGLNVIRVDGDIQNKNFSDFPLDYPDNYFQMLTAEELRSDGSFHDGNRRNEALDLRVYNKCAADFWLDAQVEAERQRKKRDPNFKGISDMQLKKLVTHTTLLNWLGKQTGQLYAAKKKGG